MPSRALSSPSFHLGQRNHPLASKIEKHTIYHIFVSCVTLLSDNLYSKANTGIRPRHQGRLWLYSFSAPAGNPPTFSSNSALARDHTGCFCQSLSASSDGRRSSATHTSSASLPLVPFREGRGGGSRLKASDASRGSSEGRWSIEMTDSGGSRWRPSTGTVGRSKVVATV